MSLSRLKMILFCSVFQRAVEVRDVKVSVWISVSVQLTQCLIYLPPTACSIISRSSCRCSPVNERLFGNSSQCILSQESKKEIQDNSREITITNIEIQSRVLKSSEHMVLKFTHVLTQMRNGNNSSDIST
jgi:hypothetical protein